MITVLAVADIGFLLGLLSHFRNLRIAVHSREEAIGIYLAKRLGKGDVLVRCEVLVMEK